jgi:hypothetical protein
MPQKLMTQILYYSFFIKYTLNIILILAERFFTGKWILP